MEDLNFEADAAKDSELSQDDKGLFQLSELVKKLRLAQQEISKLERELRIREKEYRVLETEIIPEKMKELGIELFKTNEGIVLETKNVVRASISQKNAEKAFKYLEELGADDMIKRTITVKLSKGQQELAEKVVSACEKLGVIPDEKMDVHWMTLSAFCKERLENGQPLEKETLGVFSYDQSKLKVPGELTWKRIYKKK